MDASMYTVFCAYGIEGVTLSLRIVNINLLTGSEFGPPPPLHCATLEFRRWQSKQFRVAVISCNSPVPSSGGEDLFISVRYLAPISGGGWSWCAGRRGNTPVELFIAAPVIRITPRRLGLSSRGNYVVSINAP